MDHPERVKKNSMKN